MTTNQRLSAWLHSKGKDYPEGVSIFNELCNDRTLAKFFNTSAPAKIHRSILLRKLEKYGRINKITPAPLPEVKKEVAKAALKVQQLPVKGKIERPKIDKNPVVKYDDLPVNLRLLFDENGKMMTEMKSFHAELKQLKDDESAQERRQLLAEEILKRQKTTRENWDVIDTWWNKHKEADPLAQAAEEALAKDRRIKADLAYIRRFLGKEKAREEVELRMKELDNWNVDSGNLTKNFNGTWS
jgi:hypothetical protein